MSDAKTINPDKVHIVTQADLPLACPLPDQELWNQHPRVYLPIEKSGKATCPYCSAKFILKEKQS